MVQPDELGPGPEHPGSRGTRGVLNGSVGNEANWAFVVPDTLPHWAHTAPNGLRLPRWHVSGSQRQRGGRGTGGVL